MLPDDLLLAPPPLPALLHVPPALVPGPELAGPHLYSTVQYSTVQYSALTSAGSVSVSEVSPALRSAVITASRCRSRKVRVGRRAM